MKKQSASKKARLQEPSSTKEPQQDHGEDSEKFLIELDPMSLLDCPLCLEPFVVAIYQCKNGHPACESCVTRIHGVCSYCREPIGDIRCRPLENVIAGMALPCAFAKYGCEMRVRNVGKRYHEERCRKAPCVCPMDGCAYCGSDEDLHWHILGAHSEDLYDVFLYSTKVTLHKASPFRVFLSAPHERVFLLINDDVLMRPSLSVVCIGHPPEGNQALKYQMEVSAGDSSAAALPLSASGPVTYTRRWAGYIPVNNAFLFVPDAYWSSSGTISVTVDVTETTIGDA